MKILFNPKAAPLYKSDDPISDDMPDYDGPWSVDDQSSGYTIRLCIRNNSDEFVGEVRFDKEPHETDDEFEADTRREYANANLIAAVPDMYREITEEIERMGVWIKALATDRDAIEDVVQGMEISIDNFKRLLDQAKGTK